MSVEVSKGRVRKGLSDYQIKMLFILPTIILLIMMNVFPLIWSLYLSFCDYSAMREAAPVPIGVANYGSILGDQEPWRKFTTTAIFVVCAVALEFVIGFGLALLLNRPFKGKGLVVTLFLVPMMLSPVIVGLFWKFLLDTNFGLINFILDRIFGMKHVVWLTHPRMAMLSLIIVDAWMWSPFMMLISLAGLSAVPSHLYEAAEVDRASGWFKFKEITLPLISPLLLLALLFRTIDAFKLFDLAYVLTAGGPGTATETASLYLYHLAFQKWDTGLSCALAYILLVVVIGLSNIYIRYLNAMQARI